jgi:6-phosphofructokinase
MSTAVLEQERSDLADEASVLYETMDVMLIQDGGCAPGYNPVTAFLASHLERFGRRCYAASEGFKSVVDNNDSDYRRTIYKRSIYKQEEHIPGVLNISSLSDASGARFRSERYPQFAEMENVEKAAANIIARKVNVVIAIGGNGTFKGIRDLDRILPPTVQTFFIPVTVDSDISNTETIGQHTGVEEGARKIAGYAADARTHKRIYFVEMMGARGGFHALHSCIGGRAHMAVLPGMKIDPERTVKLLNRKQSAVVVIAEGYKQGERPEGMNAAEYFLSELKSTGKELRHKVVCEAFSRDIRGARPNCQDITLAQMMAFCTTRYIEEGRSAVIARH